VNVLNEKRKKMDYTATPGRFVGYSRSTKREFVHNSLAKTHHHSRDSVLGTWTWYTAPDGADEAILNEHFCRAVIEEPQPTGKQRTWDECSQLQTEESLDEESPLEPPLRKKNSRDLAGFKMSLGDHWMLPAEGSYQNCACKYKLAVTAQHALEDEEFEYNIPFHAAAAISNNHDQKDGMDDPKSYKAAI